MIRKHNKAQSLIEYGLILGIITVALLSMQVYFKRGVQSVVKVVADDFGPQGEAVKDLEIAVKKKVYYEGYDSGGEHVPPKFAVNSKGTNKSAQTKIVSKDASVYTGTTSSSTVGAEESSVAIGADYKQRKIE